MTKIIQDPFKTTVKGTGSTARVSTTIKRIQNKIIDYGVCSDREWRYLEQHSFNEIDQKTPI